MSRFEWLIYSFVETLIIIGLFSLAAWLGFSIWAGLVACAALVFAKRCYNHPDSFIRRLASYLAVIGGSCLLGGKVISIPDFDAAPAWLEALARFLSLFSTDYFWAGVFCVSMSAVFVFAELVRLWLFNRSGEASAGMQIKAVAERPLEGTNDLELIIDAVLQNPAGMTKVLTHPRLTRIVFWPRTTPARVYVVDGHIVGGAKESIEISPGQLLHLKMEALFHCRTKFGRSVRSSALYRLIFGRRRATFKSRSDSGKAEKIIDTARLMR